MSIYDIKIAGLTGDPVDLGAYRDRAVLLVNVASQCGLTPQYAGLERLHKRFAERGFTVLAAPCNQFGEQEPGTPEEIAEFCSATFGITFPILEKIEVNGPGRHPLYTALVDTPDSEGHRGDIRWNFEKFLLAPGGAISARFSPRVDPEATEVVTAIEGALPR